MVVPVYLVHSLFTMLFIGPCTSLSLPSTVDSYIYLGLKYGLIGEGGCSIKILKFCKPGKGKQILGNESVRHKTCISLSHNGNGRGLASMSSKTREL